MRCLAHILLALSLILPGGARAEARDVPAGGRALAMAIETAGAGETLRLGPGRHRGRGRRGDAGWVAAGRAGTVGWRGIFRVLAGMGVANVAVLALLRRETAKPAPWD